jgi:hypothetical protein
MRNLAISRRHRAIAIHEAAHAIAGICFHFDFHYVTIVPTGTVSGQVEFKVESEKSDLAQWSDRRLENYLTVMLAGPAASKKQHANANPNDQTLFSDYYQAHVLIIALKKHDRQTYFKHMEKKAKRFVESHWPEIEAVAAALLEKRTLQADAVRAAMRAATPAAGRARARVPLDDQPKPAPARQSYRRASYRLLGAGPPGRPSRPLKPNI